MLTTISAATLPDIIGALGGLGLASFALVDATKFRKMGGMSNSGFDIIKRAINLFLPQAGLANSQSISSAEPLETAMLQMLHAHWINGIPLGDQKAIAKSLIKLQLNESNSVRFAKVTSVAPEELTAVAKRMNSGEGLNDALSNVLGRFDLALTAILDAAYQRADQRYRNRSKVWASFAAVVLAIFGGLVLEFSELRELSIQGKERYFNWLNMCAYFFCGILAVPLAPISKDLASAISAGVKVAQSLRK